MSVSTSLSRRGFMALASGLLVPAPPRERAYSFGPLYEHFVELVDGRQVELVLASRWAEAELWTPTAPPGAIGTVRFVEELYRTTRSVLGERLARIVAGGAEGRYFGGEFVLGSCDEAKLVSVDINGPPRHVSPRFVEPG